MLTVCATRASAPSRNPQNVLGRPDTSDERRLNPSIKEQNLDTIFAERPVAIARSKRSHVEDRRDNSELAFELKDSTLSRGEDDAFHILTDDDDNTPLWGPPEKVSHVHLIVILINIPTSAVNLN